MEAFIVFILFIVLIFYSLPNDKRKQVVFTLKIRDLFSIDIRSLAIFRIVLALTIIKDLILRAYDLKAHYTDQGVLPRILAVHYNHKQFFSLHLINGMLEAQAVLFIIAGIIAFLLLTGYRTRLVTFLSWVFLTSLQNRNIIINDIGDEVLRLILFWSMFLPLGACYSIDSALNSSIKPTQKQVFSLGTVGFFLQICFFYWFSALTKLQDSTWQNSTGVFYSLNLVSDVTPIGMEVAKLPMPVLQLINDAILCFELVGPLLLFSPIYTAWIRITTLIGFVLFQVSIGCCLDLGLISWISVFAMIPFIPGQLWDKTSNYISNSKQLNLKIYYDGNCGFCKKMVLVIRTFFLIQKSQLYPAQDDPAINKIMEENNSWVVVDEDRNQYLKFKAFIAICQASPILNLLTPIMKLTSVESLGKNLYEIVAARRQTASKFTSLFTYRPNEITLTLLENITISLLLIYIFASNISFIAPKYKIPDSLIQAGAFLNINQTWIKHLPKSPWYSGWPILPGKLKDGTKVDLVTDSTDIRWERPLVPTSLYENRHWKRYLTNTLTDVHYEWNYPSLGKYFCNKWNSNNSNEQLEEFDLYWIWNEPQPNYKFKETKSSLIWKAYCFERTESVEKLIEDLEKQFTNKGDFVRGLYAAASHYSEKGIYDKAAQAYEKAIEEHEKMLGKDHPSIVEFLGTLAKIYNALDNDSEVEKLNERIRRIQAN